MKKIALPVIFLLLISSCSSLGPAFVTMVKDNGSIHEVGTDKVKPSSKRGEACGFNILGLVAFGDLTLEKAKKDGNISEVSSVDVTFSGVLYPPLLQKCTVVEGN
jgi:hypothetical protein